MKKIFPALLVLISLKPSIATSQSVSKTMLKLPDTGQTGDYTTTFGEDADYTINAPFFIKNSNGTVTDTITGLMWQQTDGGEMTIENALIYADTLTLAGYTNWRLPTAHEGFSILNHQKTNPALDGTVFTTSAAEYWWTNDKQVNDASKVWCTNAGGGIGNHPKSETVSAGGTKKFHVRAVRDIKTPPSVSSQFTDNGNGTVKDNLTGLIWQKVLNSDTLTWENALIYAENLSLAGYSDWRLPNIKELQSLNDEKLINPSLSTAYFSNIGVKKYWSSTTLPNQTLKAWYLSTQYGITTYELKTARLSVMCVRGSSGSTTALNEAHWNSPSFDLKIYPNPITNKILQFELTLLDEDFTVQIIDVQGRVHTSQEFTQNAQGKAHLMALPFTISSGIYWLKITTRNMSKIKTLPFIIDETR